MHPRLFLLLSAVFFAISSVQARPGNIQPLDDQKLSHPETEDEDASDIGLWIEVKAEYKGFQGEVEFLTKNMTQCNHVVGGDRGFKVRGHNGEGLEFKRWGFIVNALPVINPNNPGEIDTQIQIELSGPLDGKDAVDLETWQMQTEIMTTMGKWKTISRKPAKVSVRISQDKE